MRNAIQSMLNAIDREAGGVAIVLCPDFGLRDWLVEQVESLVPEEAHALRVSDVEAALAEPTRLVLLIPKDEREAVLDLDASRDRILQEPARSQPIVLFLLRDGDGERALANEAPSLRSWIGGSDADPEALAEIDVPKERAAFEREHGVTPEAWLTQWRSGALPETASNFRKGDRQGRGAGGHAALHCHVGPDLETAPEVRVPLPAINAAEALDWVLSQIIPTDDFEPAPWAQVQAALKKASA